MSRSPLFQVMIELQQGVRRGEPFRDLTVRSLKVERVTSTFDLTLMMTDHPQGLGCEMKYSTDLFAESTIQRMLLHFEILLSAIVAHPAEPIQMLPLLSPREQEQLLYDWNTPHTVEASPDACWLQVFERLAHNQADAIAVQDVDGQQVTYAVLNQRANQLARVLQGYGAGPERLVGLCLPRTVRLVEAV